MSLTSIPQLARNADRVREIATVLARYGLAGWMARLNLGFAKGLFTGRGGEGLQTLTREARVRLALTELGTTFIKLGQVLSTRPDVVGPALAGELTALQAGAPADPPDVARATVEAELGRPVDELFAEFEGQPLASASIGQVHRARLRDGRPVVVKVQHPGIEARVRTDLAILAELARLAEQYVPEARQYQPVALAAEFQRTLLRELDFGREERHLQQFAANFADDPAVRFPAAHPELSTGRVLTMDRLEGLPLTDPRALREAGLNLEEVARRGAMVFLEMIFRDGFYHADPHPGNILVLPGGVIGLLDVGMVGRVDERLRRDLEEALLAVLDGDARRLTDLVTRLGSVPPSLDQAGLRADVADLLAYYGGRPLDQINLGAALTELTEIIRRYHIVLPSGVALLLKVLIMLEGTSRLLSPRFNLTELIREYQRKAVWQWLSPARYRQRLWRLAREWQAVAEGLPRTFTDLVRQVQQGFAEARASHDRKERSANRQALATLTGALFLGSALLWALRAPPAPGGVSIPGVLGCAAGCLLGLRLLRAIKKSGHLDPRP